MLKMKKIMGIFLAVCFVVSVTAAAVSAAPNYNGNNKYDNHDDNNKYYNHDGKNKYDDHNGKNKYDDHNGKNKYDNHNSKKKYFMQGHWGYKKVKHNKDKNHKSFWFSNDRFWIPGYWYWK